MLTEGVAEEGTVTLLLDDRPDFVLRLAAVEPEARLEYAEIVDFGDVIEDGEVYTKTIMLRNVGSGSAEFSVELCRDAHEEDRRFKLLPTVGYLAPPPDDMMDEEFSSSIATVARNKPGRRGARAGKGPPRVPRLASKNLSKLHYAGHRPQSMGASSSASAVDLNFDGEKGDLGDHEVRLRVDFSASHRGRGEQLFRLLQDGELHGYITVRGNVIAQRLQLLELASLGSTMFSATGKAHDAPSALAAAAQAAVQNAASPLTELDMDCVFYDTVRRAKAVIFNDRPVPTSFVVTPLSHRVWTHTSNGREACASYVDPLDIVEVGYGCRESEHRTRLLP